MKKIDIKELRVGNYVNAEVNLPSLQRHKLLSKDFNYINDGSVYVYGIPLTEEILLMCGSQIIKTKSGFIMSFKLKSITIHVSSNFNYYYKKNVYNTVHQIQNLYHAIEQEELIINL